MKNLTKNLKENLDKSDKKKYMTVAGYVDPSLFVPLIANSAERMNQISLEYSLKEALWSIL